MSKYRNKIIMVDDNKTNLSQGKSILSDYYETYPVTSAAKMFELLDNVSVDLILLDVMMPEMDGFEAIKKLKANDKFKNIPVIFLTSKDDKKSELDGFNLGAIDYVSKPFSAPVLLKRIENHLLLEKQREELIDWNENLQEKVEENTAKIIRLEGSLLSTIVELVEFRDSNTGGHIHRTQRYLESLIEKMQELGIYEEELKQRDLNVLIPASQLHDVGKIAISDAILNKPGKLSTEEFEIMKRHPTIGVEILEGIRKNVGNSDFLYYASIFAGTHQEKWDGTGYPLRLRGKEIPLEGRLMAIGDVYDALISKRPYKEPIAHEEACKTIIEGSGTHFDPILVDVFEHVSDKFKEIAEEYNN